MAVPSTAWAVDAACLDRPDWTAASTPKRQLQLLEVCAGCPVLADCRDWAAGFKWYGVVIGGLAHPRSESRRPQSAAEMVAAMSARGRVARMAVGRRSPSK